MEAAEPTLKSAKVFHPALFALHPPLALYAANVSLIPLQDVVLPALICLAGGLALWGVLWIAVRNRERSALAASVAILAFFSYGPLKELASIPIWFYGLAIVGICLLASRPLRIMPAANQVLNFAGAAMCLLALGSAASAHWTIRSELARSRTQEVGPSGSQAASGLPDIYYLVLDGYGRTDTFERLYDFSDSALTGWLRNQGFFVADRARSNYVQTELSLASSLNMAPVETLVKPLGSASKERLLLDALIDDNRVVRELRKLGYRYFAVTSGFPALTFDSADVVVRSDSGSSLFVQALRDKTPFPLSRNQTGSMFDSRRIFLEDAFRSLARMAPPSAAPKFVVAHILAPHPPFVFDAGGQPIRPKKGPYGYWDGSHFVEMVGSAAEYRQGYRGQAQYIARRTKETVERLLSRPGPKPIILIQGDHGPKSQLDQNDVQRTDLDECFGILSAYYFPDGSYNDLRPEITPLNSFGIVLNKISGRRFERQEEHSAYSTWDRPLGLIDVTDQISD